jgi:hypothetical protein
MMLNKQRLTLNLFIFLLIIFVLAVWSATILTEWGTDYGVYYTGSYFLSDNYKLYQEHFDHKGPLYYLFLQTIGYFIGWGHWQAYLSLFLTMLVFYLPVFCILVSERLKPMSLFAGTLLSLCLLYGQPTNASISFFQSGFLLTSFWLLAKHYKNTIRLNISFFLFVCSILTRIDAVIYFPVYLFALILTSNTGITILHLYKKFFIWILIFIIPYWCLSYKFNFNLNDYLVHNFEFNAWYVKANTSSSSLFYKVAKSLIRPESYKLFISSLLILPLFIIFPQLKSGFYEFISYIKILYKKKIIKNFISDNAFSSVIFFLGAIGWFLTFSDKNYHLLILLVPLLFFYLINFRFLSLGQCSFITLASTYCLVIILYLPLLKLNKDPECLYSPFCNSSDVKSYADSVNFLSDLPHDEVVIIGGRGWTYFYSGKKTSRSINDWWLYELDNSFLTPQLVTQHQNLLKMSPGYSFLVDNRLLEKDNKNKLLSEVIYKAELLERQLKYSVFKIR